jgi:hypothetical protein
VSTCGSGSPNHDNVGVVDEGNDEDDKEHEEVANNFGRTHGESAGHWAERGEEYLNELN